MILSWKSCQRRLFPEVQRLLPHFFKLTNLKCSYSIFNGIVYLKYILGKSHRLGIVYAPCVVIWHSLPYDSTLTWSRDQQAARLLWRNDSAADSVHSAGHSYLLQYCPPGCVLLWTLKLNSYKITQHWLMLPSVSDPLGSCFQCQSFQCESSMRWKPSTMYAAGTSAKHFKMTMMSLIRSANKDITADHTHYIHCKTYSDLIYSWSEWQKA